MTLLERYIFKRALALSAGSLVSLVLIVWIVQALARIDIVKTSVSAAGNIFWIALMLLPDLAAGVIPFAILVGSVQALNSFNADSERAVMSAAGAAPGTIARPIVAVGLVGAFLVLLISHVIGPLASSAFQNGIRAINADTITLFLQPGRFERIQSGLVLSIGESHGNTIESLFIADTRDPKTEITYFAREANIVSDNGRQLLLLSDGQLHRRNTGDNSVSVIEFQSYAFDLADLKPASKGDWIRTSERSTLELLSPDPDDDYYRTHPSNFVEELTDRFSGFLYCIAFALWAVVVAAHPRTNRQGSGASMGLGLAGGLSLKAAGFVTLSLIDENYVWVLFTFALPLGAIALDATLVWRNVNLGDLAISRWLSDATYATTSFVHRLTAGKLSAGGSLGR
ncbi:LptF/LptG family permease [Aurantimonas sp. VKM B-3413]|uniref:LptF/LptG family permease n=1 Tax=Aurantimonas sp. VKM B-3413 TaxID=2779401 RepID=UPI001E42B00E|nr:LptF/LptG family permease [Aurantimonas sp. VKM B-3413]MCB8836007.1 LptF/LptG family permease [Aurantimonas sp. VKM B-3413]